MSGRLFVLILMTSVWRWLVTSFARLLGNSDISPANFFRICQARGDGWYRSRELAIIEIEFLNPIPESEELGGFDKLENSDLELDSLREGSNSNAPLAPNRLP